MGNILNDRFDVTLLISRGLMALEICGPLWLTFHVTHIPCQSSVIVSFSKNYLCTFFLNSLAPSDVLWHYMDLSTLVQVITWTNVDLSLIICKVLWYLLDENFSQEIFKISINHLKFWCHLLGITELILVFYLTWTKWCISKFLVISTTWLQLFTHWGRDEIDAILQTTFSNAFLK